MSEITIHTEILALLYKQVKDEPLSAEEYARLREWEALSPHISNLVERIQNDKELLKDLSERYSLDKGKAWQKLASRIAENRAFDVTTPRIPFLRHWWAAASIILLLGIGTYFWITNKKNTPPAYVAAQTADIAPGKNGAILTLANGMQVVLDSMGNGVIAKQNGAQVRLNDGRLAYDPTGSASGEVVYNTMTTPKGRQFQVVLPDGTKVWLNAASSITYPTVFNGEERQVQISGEVYLEVAKNPKMPFRVNVNGKAEVEVLGTHFNVNAYDDEISINTTLLEGSVRVMQTPVGHKTQTGNNNSSQVMASDRPVILKPGQQAQISNVSDRAEDGTTAKSGIKVVDDADIDKALAWKKGWFNFNDANLYDVMRQLERWYDIKVKYEGSIPDVKFKGEMDRGVHLSGILTLFSSDFKIKTKLDGRTLIISGD